jgi:hypothetical protein
MKEDIQKSPDQNYTCGGGAMCGGVINKSLFNSDPWAYMMQFVMPDDKFELYKNEEDPKKRKELFDKYAISMI